MTEINTVLLIYFLFYLFTEITIKVWGGTVLYCCLGHKINLLWLCSESHCLWRLLFSNMWHCTVIEVYQSFRQTCCLHQTEAVWSPEVLVHFYQTMWCDILQDSDFQGQEHSILFSPNEWAETKMICLVVSNFYPIPLSHGFRLKASMWCWDYCQWVHWPKWQHSSGLVLYSHLWIAPRPLRWQLTHYLKPIESWTTPPIP